MSQNVKGIWCFFMACDRRSLLSYMAIIRMTGKWKGSVVVLALNVLRRKPEVSLSNVTTSLLGRDV